LKESLFNAVTILLWSGGVGNPLHHFILVR